MENLNTSSDSSIRAEVRTAFEEMKRTEMLLDDMDYMENSPRLQAAMRAAENFRIVLEKAEHLTESK